MSANGVAWRRVSVTPASVPVVLFVLNPATSIILHYIVGCLNSGHIWSGSMILPPFCLHACSVIRTKPLPLHVFIPWQPWLKLLQRL